MCGAGGSLFGIPARETVSVAEVELQRSLEPITRKELTNRLRELEAAGMAHRKVYAEVPPRVEYWIFTRPRFGPDTPILPAYRHLR